MIDKITLANIFSLLVAIFALLVAFWTSYISREKLRLDLYNKRFNIYERVLNYVFLLNKGEKLITHEKLDKIHDNFILAFRESKYLFKKNSGVYEAINEIMEAGVALKGYYEDPRLRENACFCEKINQIKFKLPQKFGLNLEEAMDPYLFFGALENNLLNKLNFTQLFGSAKSSKYARDK